MITARGCALIEGTAHGRNSALRRCGFSSSPSASRGRPRSSGVVASGTSDPLVSIAQKQYHSTLQYGLVVTDDDCY